VRIPPKAIAASRRSGVTSKRSINLSTNNKTERS
jgi:hypothetical protein